MSGAIGSIQLKKFPKFLYQRQKNSEKFLAKMQSFKDIIVQKEIGRSSWFGFSLVINKESNLKRKNLIKILNKLGFECRPIVAGNFAKNEVTKYFDSEISDDLENADYIDKNGLFIGNHHLDMRDAINSIDI